MNKKSGFTLAEVLVTLMIIGVIASMTIPSLMQSTAQQEYRAAMKKALSMMNQAISLNYAIDGQDASDGEVGRANIEVLLKKRMNVMSTVSGGGFYTADGMFFKYNNGANASCDVDNNTVCANVLIDVNGMKKPNKYTTSTTKVFDLFTVNVYAQKVLPGNNVYGEVLYKK